MPSKSPHFYWHVAEKGYRWINENKDEIDSASYLVQQSPDDSVSTYYPLLDHTGLFQEFARLSLEPDAILAFANQYGNLLDSQSGPQDSAASFSDWKDEVLTLKQILELWQMVHTRDNINLSNQVQWEDDCIIFKQIYNPMHRSFDAWLIVSVSDPDIQSEQSSSSLYTHLPINQRTFDRFEKNDLFKPTLYLMQHLTNYKIKNRIKPVLMMSDKGQKLNLNMKPTSLMGAVWLQCVMALNEQKQYASCSTCHKWFELPKNVINKGKKYCADACKSKAYRQRSKKKKENKKEKKAA